MCILGLRLIKINTCPAILNYYINHRKIKHFLFQDTDPESIDASGILGLPDTYCFTFPGGCLLFWLTSDNNYTADIYCISRTGGAAARQAAKEALSYVFSSPQSPKAITARAPIFNAKSRHFIVGLGFKRIGIEPGAFLRNGVRHDVAVYEIGREEWDRLSEQ